MLFVSFWIQLLSMLVTVPGSNGTVPVASWKFETHDSLVVVEKVSGKSFAIQSKRNKPEFVRGVDGTALRLDGYSTYVTGDLSHEVSGSFSLTGWFALETLPTDTAGFFSISNRQNTNWITASVDYFGRPLISVSTKGDVRHISGERVISNFKWMHIVLAVSENQAIMFVNGKPEVKTNIDSFTGASFSNIKLGLAQQMKNLYGYFPVSAINGLIDEVSLWNQSLPIDKVKALYQDFDSSQKPDLLIPPGRFAKDFNRPKYHVLPAANWTNETHGLIYYRGRYHIFNQKNGSNLYIGQINWGHFSSPDLLQWTEHKPALAPDQSYDKNGIWSGHAILDEKSSAARAATWPRSSTA